jgi:hypothetical protein
VNEGAKTVPYSYNWYISSNDYADDEEYAYHGWGYSAWPSASTLAGQIVGVNPPGTKWMNNYGATVQCDRNIYIKHYGEWWWESRDLNWTQTKNLGPFLSKAATPTVGTCTPGSATAFQITVSGMSWIPATYDTAVNLILQYKETSSGTWLDWATVHSSKTGYSTLYPANTNVTGLTPDTSYDFRLKIDRTGTVHGSTLFYGASASLSTLPDVPTVTTLSPTSIGVSSAVFRATVDYNSHPGLLYCRWDTSDPGTPNDSSGTLVGYTDTVPMISADGTYTGFGFEGGPVTGLIDVDEDLAETFYVWAIYKYGGTDYDDNTIFGDVVEFTTQAVPGAGGDEVDFMIPLQFDGQYGVSTTVYFTLRGLAAANNDTFYDSTAPSAANVDIFIDGTEWQAGAGSDNAPQKITGSKLYKLQLSIAEMSGTIIDVVISDGGTAFRDVHIQVRTRQYLSQLNLNADQIGGGAVSALYAKGVGAGHGIEAIGGATGHDIEGILGKHVLAHGSVTSGSGTSVALTDGYDGTSNDLYNGDIIMFYAGTGAGQSRIISDSTNAGAITLATALIASLGATTKYIIIPGPRALDDAQAEITSVPTDSSTIKEKIQFLFQRFAFRIKQTATTQTWYESDNTTEFAQRSASDDGSTQDLGKLADP